MIAMHAGDLRLKYDILTIDTIAILTRKIRDAIAVTPLMRPEKRVWLRVGGGASCGKWGEGKALGAED